MQSNIGEERGAYNDAETHGQRGLRIESATGEGGQDDDRSEQEEREGPHDVDRTE